jgi:hypothetical protein
MNRFHRNEVPELPSPVINVEAVRECATECNLLLGAAADHCRKACAQGKRQTHG